MGYKRYGSSQSIPNFNDDNNGEAVSNGILKNSSKKEIYFGIKKPKSAADSDKPWRELTTDDFDTQITSDTDGCSATITQNTNDLTNKTGIIRYTLSKNTTGSTRLITFNYKGTELFKINQDADNNIMHYTVIWDLQNGNINGNTASIQDVVNHGDTVSFSKYKPVRTNYIFNGWSSNISATSGSTVGNSAPITQHTTFYATWKQLSKTVTFRFGGPVINNNIIITWNDLSLPDVEFTIKIKDITNNSTFDITIPRNYQSSGYTTNKTFISGHQYQLVSCSPTKVGNTTYQVFTGVAFDM